MPAAHQHKHPRDILWNDNIDWLSLGQFCQIERLHVECSSKIFCKSNRATSVHVHEILTIEWCNLSARRGFFDNWMFASSVHLFESNNFFFVVLFNFLIVFFHGFRSSLSSRWAVAEQLKTTRRTLADTTFAVLCCCLIFCHNFFFFLFFLFFFSNLLQSQY